MATGALYGPLIQFYAMVFTRLIQNFAVCFPRRIRQKNL